MPPVAAPAPVDAAPAGGWRGPILPVNTESGDGRVYVLADDTSLDVRPLPLPLCAQDEIAEGHDGGRVVGRMDRVWVEDGAVWGEGTFDLADPNAAEWARRLSEGYAGWISADMDRTQYTQIARDELGNEVTPEALATGEVAEGMPLIRVTQWRLMGATLVAGPAFAEAKIAAADVVGPIEPVTAALTAAGIRYRAADFADPQLAGPTALTVDEAGHVFGHLALFDSCHIGFANECVSPPHSASNYAYFHNGVVSTDGGDLPVGKLTLGTGHASLGQDAAAAAAHYDHSGTATAVVRAGEDEHGIWLAGRILPGTGEARLDEMRRCGVSGDWRSINGSLELVAALCVNVPGFPIPRTEALAASGSMALVAAGIVANSTSGGTRLPCRPTVSRRDHHDALAALDKRMRAAQLDMLDRRMKAARLADLDRRMGVQTRRYPRLRAAARGRFDESQHARDGNGRFARTQGERAIDDTPPGQQITDPPFRQFTRRWPGTDASSVTPRVAGDIREDYRGWLDFNARGRRMGREQPSGFRRDTLGRTTADYDMEAVVTDTLTSGLNAHFINDGDADDADLDVMADAMWQILERNRRPTAQNDGPPTEAVVHNAANPDATGADAITALDDLDAALNRMHQMHRTDFTADPDWSSWLVYDGSTAHADSLEMERQAFYDSVDAGKIAAAIAKSGLNLDGIGHPDVPRETQRQIVQALERMSNRALISSAGAPRRMGKYGRRAVAASASGDHSTDGMIALVPSAADAARLAVDGGEPVDEMHLTIAYFPDATEMGDPAETAALVAEQVGGPVTGEVNGHAMFHPGGDNPCAVYLVQAPGLSAANQVFAPPGDYDSYTPHITAAYNPTAPLVETGPITFDRVRVAYCGSYTDVALSDDEEGG